jgi:hypothetical protein
VRTASPLGINALLVQDGKHVKSAHAVATEQQVEYNCGESGDEQGGRHFEIKQMTILQSLKYGCAAQPLKMQQQRRRRLRRRRRRLVARRRQQ